MKCSSSYSSTSPSPASLGFKNSVAQAFLAAMSCIFSCFRVKDVSPPSTTKDSCTEETVDNRNRSPLSSFFVSQENACTRNKEKRLKEKDLDFEELKNQAKFLKACGTIPETPTEIRKIAGKENGLSSHQEAVESLEFRSWLTYTSVEKLDLEGQPDQLQNVNNDCEEWVDGAGAQEHTPSRVLPNSNGGIVVPNAVSSQLLSTLDHSSADSSVSISTTGPSIPYKNKSVRFDCQLDMYSASPKSYLSETPTQTLNESGSAGSSSNVKYAKPSPYPTPLNLTAEMQTPGTVYPAYVDAIGNRKYPMIRTQFVSHSAINPVEGLSELKVSDDGDPLSDQLDHHGQESFEKADESGKVKTGETETSIDKDLIPESGMYPLAGVDSPNLDAHTVVQNVHRVRNPGDRPIIGLVAAHWNDNEASRVSPKWWDGNGIPNSTNKYQEDQKVSWHATPFEERLEKALSEETLISQRKQSTGTPPPIDFGESEESDTALSQLKSSTHFKPVVSF